MNERIKISKAANGFIVEPDFGHMCGAVIADSEIKVYESMDNLVEFVKGHFTDPKTRLVKPDDLPD